MKKFTDSIRGKHPRLEFILTVAGFYLMMMILYIYFMMASLSSAPKYVYTQF